MGLNEPNHEAPDGAPGAPGAPNGSVAGDAHADLAAALAEAAAGLPGAAAQLSARLTSTLRALLRARMAAAPEATFAQAGQAVQELWQQIANAEHASGGCGAATDGADHDADHDADQQAQRAAALEAERQAARALYPVYIEHAARAMQGLVHRAARCEPPSRALNLLDALQALEPLEPQLALSARQRWFGGLSSAYNAPPIGEPVEPAEDAERNWLKARAYIAAAASMAPPAIDTSA